MGSIADQILLYLHDCIDYGFSYRLKKGLFIIDEFPGGWKKVSKKQMRESIRSLNKLKFVQKKEKHDGSIAVSLTDKGRLRALNISFRNFNNKKEKWDGKWRMIAFDIPDERRKGRNALRYRLGTAGFHKLQESLFLCPYDCEKEIRNFIKLFGLEKYVRFALIGFIDNEKEIKAALGIK